MDFKAAVVVMEGTNCEMESKMALERVGFNTKYVHIKKLEPGIFEDIHVLMLPGGFSAGDYIRAGAIFAARLRSQEKVLRRFVEEGKVIIGVCNGFQVLVELGMLPGFDVIDDKPHACLTINESNRFECRWTYLKIEDSVCRFTENMKEIIALPVAHAEGRFICEEEVLEEMIRNRQIVFRYVNEKGKYALYPWNPNGSIYNIAGISNTTGNVLGMMPHPERAQLDIHRPDYYLKREKVNGLEIFKGIYRYVAGKF